MRSIEICPLIGTVFSQRQQEKNIFRVDNTFKYPKYDSLREYTIRINNFINRKEQYQMSTSNSMIDMPIDTIFNTPTIKLAPLTILTGCNNTGKTTIIKNIQEWCQLRQHYIKYYKWKECSTLLFDIGQNIFSCNFNILEQPECGLHPIAQLEIADKIIELTHRSLFTIVETHSDHIINRVTRRYVEGVIRDKDMIIYHSPR